MKNRSREEILADILECAGDGNTLTRIMYGAYLSYNQLKDCLSILQKNKMIELKGRTYYVTEKGKRYVQRYRQINKMVVFDA